MRKAIDREVSAIDGQDLIESGIVVHDGKHSRVDIRERLIDVLGQYVSRPLVSTTTEWAHIKQFWDTVHQFKDAQCNAGVLSRTNSAIVSELRKCLAHDQVRDCDPRALHPSREDVLRGPGMMPVASVDCRDQ